MDTVRRNINFGLKELLICVTEIIFSPLIELRQSLVSSGSEGEEQLVPKRVLTLSDVPTHLAFASNDDRLVVSFARGTIAIYDTTVLLSAGSNNVEPLRTFPAAPPGAIRQVLANPADLPDLVAVRRDAENGGDGLAVEIIDVKQLQSIAGWSVTAPKDAPTSSEQIHNFCPVPVPRSKYTMFQLHGQRKESSSQ